MKSTIRKIRRVLTGALGFFCMSAHGLEAPTTASAEARLQQLRAEIAHHDELYFKKAAPEITDAAYDSLKRELRALEQQFPALAAGDPSTGDDRSGDFPTIAHRVRMQGLGKTYTEAELRAFLAKTRRALGDEAVFVVEPKYDGLAIAVTYERGRLVRAVTRGNGGEGDDVTANFLALCEVPPQLAADAGAPIPEVVELRGEVFMTFAEFKRINAEIASAGGEPFTHPRNLATGTLKQTTITGPKRRLSVVFYGWGAVEPANAAPHSQRELHRLVRAWGLPGVADVRIGVTDDELWRAVQEFGALRPKWPFPTDGAVLKIDVAARRAQLGEAEDVPRWAIAYKFAPEQAATRLLAITLQVGRTGAITPVAKLEPVKLGGATIRRVSLHNREDIARRDLRVGDVVMVERAGEVIPVIASVDKTKRAPDAVPFQFPAECPACRALLVSLPEQAAVRCPNHDCPAQIQRRLEYFASDDCAKLDGFGPGVIEKLVARGMLREPADFFRLDGVVLKGVVGEKTAARLLAAAERGRSRETWRFVLGLGVQGVGPVAAKAIARKFPDLDALSRASAAEFLDGGRSRLSGVSDATAAAFVAFLDREGGCEAVRRLQAALARR
ncbi:MAG: NAD-dependent DNA ligase LigA [Opitutae bacterium]|nr:NAD-dependent DNA ligase LigA [Opitutae bacterium]